jgi:hypothetical protein
MVMLYNADGDMREVPEAWAASHLRMLEERRSIVVTSHDKALEDEVEWWLWDRHLARCKPETPDAFWAVFCTEGLPDLTWGREPWEEEAA